MENWSLFTCFLPIFGVFLIVALVISASLKYIVDIKSNYCLLNIMFFVRNKIEIFGSLYLQNKVVLVEFNNSNSGVSTSIKAHNFAWLLRGTEIISCFSR